MAEALLEREEVGEAGAEAPRFEGRCCLDVVFGWQSVELLAGGRPAWRRLRLPGFRVGSGREALDLAGCEISAVFEDKRNARLYVRFVGGPLQCEKYLWADGADAPVARPQIDGKLARRVVDVREGDEGYAREVTGK